MASEVASTVISTVTGWVMSAVGQEIDYAWNCNDYIGELTRELEKLKHARGRVRRLVTDARKGGEKIEPFVDEWLKSVKEFIDEAEKFLQDKERAQQKCVGGLCRPWKTRYEMGRRAKEEMLQTVNELKVKKETFADGVSYRDGPKGIGPIKGYEEFESRKSIIANILKALTDPNVHKIGIYGINGVGKTTLVREIARQVEEKNLFDEVLMATVFPDQNMEERQGEAIVKKTPNIKGIQDEVADGLDFHFGNKSDRKRADELCERLKDQNRKLLVLDNVWAGLDLTDVGIPSDHEGCKIVMISTNEKVLSDEMDSKNNFQLNVLTAEDAEAWFKKMVGDVAKVPDLEEYITQVAQRCAGLPILLISVARGLKDNGELDAWKDALKQLSSFDKEEMHAKVDLALQLSYNLLGGDEIKKLFLLCAQLRPNGISTRSLLRYAMGLELFKGRNTVEGVHFRLLKLLNDLKSCCLLLEGTTQRYLKMHDIVHNFAVSVASRDHHVFIAAYDSVLSEWPGEDVLKQCTAISLPYCKIPELPPVLDCPNLESFLLLTKKNRSLKIPEKLFERMRKLKVLDITGVHLLSLPPSFQFLENLRTLCLDQCILGDMTLLGKLKTLRVLSFGGSDIIELPRQVKKLTQLQFLNLKGCKRLEVIPPNVLSSLTSLEDLCMENSFLQWEFEGRNSRIKNASLDELKLLPSLKMLDIHITNVKMLPKGSFLEKLERFKIFIGDGWDWYGEYKTLRTLKLKLSMPGKLEKGIRALLKRAEDLYLDELKGIGTSLDELDGQGFPRLKHLHLENSHEIQYVINSVEMVGFSAFTSLESLFLDNLENLEKICHGRLLAESFRQLKSLKVGRCGGLKNLFSSSMARGLLRLEEITIADCRIMEEIVSEESDGDAHRDEPIKFTQLRMLELKLLPQLKRFCSNKMASSMSEEKGQVLPETDANPKETSSKNDPKTAESVSNKNTCFCGLFCSKRKATSSSATELNLPERTLKAIIMENDPLSLFNKKVSFPNMKELKLTSIMIEKIWHDPNMGISCCIPNLTSLVVDGCDNMKCLLSSSMAESLGNLKKLEISNCKLMEEIILTEGLDVEGKSKMQFQKLEFLYLKDLPNLVRFCDTNLLKCPALKKLVIDNCTKLKTFISNVGVNVNGDGQTVNSTLFDEKVAFPNLESLVIFNMNELKTICHNKLYENSFSKLKRLDVMNVEELQNVFPSHYVLRRFQNLECLVVINCSSLEKVFDIQDLKDEKAGSEMLSSKLRILYIAHLPKLKCIWNNDSGEIHSFQDLHTVTALHCPNVKSLFPLYMARSLRKLTSLDIDSCGVEEIISYEEGLQTAAEFEFPQLTLLKLWKLPQLKRFYPGKQTVEFPKLKYLHVYECDNIEIFTSESQSVEQECSEEDHLDGAQQPLMSAEKVIPNLELLTLNSKDVKMISGGQSTQDLYPNVKTLHLQCFHDDPTAFPFVLIKKFVNLKELVIANSCFTEVFSYENLVGDVSEDRSHAKIRYLQLALLYNLKHVKLDHVFGNLETLEVLKCEKLSILAPSSASFDNLTVLVVAYCDALMTLVTFSTAKSMVQLRKIIIEECNLMTEVLASDGEDGKEIVFHKLESLVLISLKNLNTFSPAKWTLKFPSLEEVVVSQCPKMRTFSNGSLEAAKLRGVKTKGDERHWQSDLNATIKHLYAELAGFDGLMQLKLSEFTELDDRWPKQIPGSFFSYLLSLVVDKCESSSIAVPSSLLPSLKVLQELEIRNCDSVQEVFDSEKPNSDENSQYLFKLAKFHLFDLPKLSQIWNEYSTGILNLKNLKVLKVHNCGSLGNIFTPSMAARLVHLEEMEVKSCHMIKEIIAIEEAPKEAAEKIVFPLLNSVTLENLPKLRSFYYGSGSVDFPSLKNITVVDCPSAFLSTFLKEEEPSISEDPRNQPVAVPSLEKLIVEWSNSIEEVLHGQCRADVLRKLKAFELVRFSHDHSVFPSHFLRRLSSLENLVVSDAPIEEIVLHEGKNDDNLIEILAQLKELKLSKLPKLKFLSKNDLKSSLVFQNLESLEVLECRSLEILVPSSVSFRCLKSLKVSKCHGLIAVITSSTAKSLVQLTTLSINDCEMVKEIITNNDDGVENEIVFSKLKQLRLIRLSRLKSFYLGMCALRFPSLEELKVTECPNMEIISQADLRMPKLKKVEVTEGAALRQLLAKMGHFEVQPKRSLTRQPTKGVKNAIAENSTTLSVPAGQASDIAVSEKSRTLGVPAGQTSDIVISEKKITLSVPAGQTSDIATEEKNATLSIPGERVSNDFLETKHVDSSSPAKDETIINVAIETSTQSEINQLALTTQDFHATSSPEENTTQIGLVLHKETHISVQIEKHPQVFDQNEQVPDDVTPDSSHKQSSTIPVFSTAVEQATLSTAANSTLTMSSKDVNNITASMPTSENLVQLAVGSSHTPADFECLFTSMEDLLKPHQELSSKPSSSLATHAKFQNSNGASTENYAHSMDLIKKILKKSLAEVARSSDAHKLLINLKNLKNSPDLNSQQVEIIQGYIENFDSLVAYHPFYEQQINMGSSLNHSIKEKQRSLANLKTLYQDFTGKTSSLSETKETLKKRLHEIEEEENRLRASIELLYSDLVAKKGELETDIDVLPEAARRQQEAAEKASMANDSWEKLKNLFT